MAEPGRSQRITTNSQIFGGMPIVRDLRISVATLLAQMAHGSSEAELLADYPELEHEDLRACLEYACGGLARRSQGSTESPAEARKRRHAPVPALGIDNLSTRVTIEPSKCGGRPCIRGRRVRVTDILQLLAHGASFEEIQADYPSLVREDILAALAYAAQQTRANP